MARRSCTLSIIALTAPVLLAGCATMSPKPGFDTVSDLVSARSPGRTVVWNQGTADDEAAAQRVRELLADELTLDAAIQIALLDNRALQAVYAQLGIAQADVVQAGLLQNPILSADVRFPTVQGAAIGAAAGLVQEFISMLQIPLRKRVAAAAFDEATLTASASIVDLVTAVKRAYYRLQGAEQLLELRRTVRDATGLSADIARRQHDAGNVTNLDLANESALAEQAGADLARAETEVADDREELTALMGLWGGDAAGWRIASHLPELPSDDVRARRAGEPRRLAAPRSGGRAPAHPDRPAGASARGRLPLAAVGRARRGGGARGGRRRVVDRPVRRAAHPDLRPGTGDAGAQRGRARAARERARRAGGDDALAGSPRPDADGDARDASPSSIAPCCCRCARRSSSRRSSSTTRCSPASSSCSWPSATRSTPARRTSKRCATTGWRAPSWRAPSAASWWETPAQPQQHVGG